MSWPLSQDYNEALQDRGNNFSDVELKTGEAVANALGIPMPRSGNFDKKPILNALGQICPTGTRLIYNRVRPSFGVSSQRSASYLLNVRRPDKPGSELGTSVGSRSIVLPPNKWCTFHWQIKSSGMKVSINKQIFFQEAFRYDLTAKYPVKIRVNAESIEVKSVAVKELKK